MKFVLATHNPNKVREMSAILGQFGVEVVSPKELGITVEVEETGTTFAENAMLKARAICELAKLPAAQNGQPLSLNKQRRIAMAQAGLGDAAAVALEEATIHGQQYISVEELQQASGVANSVFDKLRSVGALGSLPETSQVDLFSLM